MYPVQLFGEQKLLAAAKAVTALALKLDIRLVPSGRHTCPRHEVSSVDLRPVPWRLARKTFSDTFVVDCPKPDELAEDAVELFDCRAAIKSRLSGGFGTGCVPTFRARLF